MGQIVVDLFHLSVAVYIVLVLMRVASQVLADRAPALAHAIEFGIGK